MDVISRQLDHAYAVLVDPDPELRRSWIGHERNRIGRELVELHMRLEVGLRQEQALARVRMIPAYNSTGDPSLQNIVGYLCKALRGEDARDLVQFNLRWYRIVDPKVLVL